MGPFRHCTRSHYHHSRCCHLYVLSSTILQAVEGRAKGGKGTPVPEGFEDIYNSHIDKIRSNSVFGKNPLHQQQQMRSHHPLDNYSVKDESSKNYAFSTRIAHGS